MSKQPMRHCEDGELLQFADGELPTRAAGEVRSHLEACWQCRVELEDVQQTVAECVRYRKDILQLHLPPPPAPWIDIYRRFEAIDASMEPDFFSRLARAVLPRSGAKRWALATVTLLVMCGLFFRFRQTPSVQAAELLRKATMAADAHPVQRRRIQIRTKAHRVTRPPTSVTDTDTLNAVQALFQAANYDWEDPLSAKAYQAWRDRLANKQDQVIEQPDAYRIRTNTSLGELAEVTLKLRMQDLHPVEERFEFRNREWVEITELAEEPMPARDATAEAVHTSAPTAPPNGTPVLDHAAFATNGDELHVLAVLHQLGADLGDPIEISRAGAEVVVSGVGIPQPRQREIEHALGSRPHVQVRFSESASAKIQPDNAAIDNPASGDILQLQARISDQVGGRANFEQLAAQVLDLSDPMMSRVYALRRLAERFPVEVELELNLQDQQLLRNLRQEHAAALRQVTADIDRVLKPVLASVNGVADPASAGVTSSDTWQRATEKLFQSARRVERLLAVMFGAAPGDSSGQQVPGQLLYSLTRLRSGLEAYDRIGMERRSK
jgi:anti-sigma factor RsiW